MSQNSLDSSYIVTYLVGNGFDLGCGLKSRFEDTYHEYIKIKSDGDTVSKFKEQIKNFLENKSKNDKDNSDIKNKEIKWSDFEMGMAEYASQLSSEEEFVECVRNYSNYLVEYLRKEESTFYGKYFKDTYTREVWKEHLLNSFVQYDGGLNNNTKKDLLMAKAGKVCKKFNIINFNYTQTFETILGDLSENKLDVDFLNRPFSTNHIHGTLSEGIVLGVDNIGQFGETEYSLTEKGKLCFIKPFLNNQLDAERVANGLKEIEESNLIIVVGMSLGESDLTWKTALAKWLLNSENHHIIYYDFDMMLKENVPPFDVLFFEKQAKDDILKKLVISDKIYNQIHVPIGKLFFNPCRIPVEIMTGVPVAHPPIFR